MRVDDVPRGPQDLNNDSGSQAHGVCTRTGVGPHACPGLTQLSAWGPGLPLNDGMIGGVEQEKDALKGQ
jgi:hypothetical protein